MEKTKNILYSLQTILRRLRFVFYSILLSVPLLKAQVKASFVANPNKGCAPATIKFTDQSTGTGLTYFWDLGNGNTSTLAEPKAIYYLPGTYTIRLKVTDGFGKTDSITKTNYIEVFKNPMALFDAKTVNGCIPFDPELNDKSIRGSGIINEWTWDYGNGKVISGQAPVHAYTTAGVYTISLTVKDANGCKSDTFIKNYITANQTPDLLFSSDKQYNCVPPLAVNFINKSTGLTSGDNYEWDFGDGTKSTDKNPKKTYNDTGSFNVSLKVYSANGCTTSIVLKNYILIAKPKISFDAYPNPICLGTVINFYSTTKPSNVYFKTQWDMGDGTKITDTKTPYTYKYPGTYTIKINVSLPDGSCKDSLTFPKIIRVLPKPKANFLVKDTLLCLPGIIDTLIDKSIGGTIRYWYLNDQFISNKTGVILYINKVGYNKIKLISGNGYCFDTIEKLKAIYVDSIEPIISLLPRKGCVPLTVQFNEATITRLPITSWLWDLGDGNFQNLQHFDYTYTKTGKYLVKLTITTKAGCKVTVQDSIYVSPKPKAFFNYPFTAKCNGDTVSYFNVKNIGKTPINEYKWYIDNFLVSESAALNFKIRMMPDTYDITLVVGNNGCRDTIKLKDILKIKAPLVSIGVNETKCKRYPITYKNTSIQADSICWYMSDGSKIFNQDSIVVANDSAAFPVYLWGKNNTTLCEEKIINTNLYGKIGAKFYASGPWCTPSLYTINNQSEYYTKFNWNWGDGTFMDINDKKIYKLYTKPGDYTITLIAADENGCYDTVKRQIKILGPKADLEIFPKNGCGPHTMTLINKTDKKDIKNIYWKISGVNPILATSDTMYYTFKKPGPLAKGAYDVTLTATDNTGCVGTKSDKVTIGGIDYKFEILQLPTCTYPKYTVMPIFNQSVDQKNLNYFWDVGDGRKFNGTVIDYYYKAPGLYTVTLKIIDGNGCVTEKDTFINMREKDLTAKVIADKLEANCPPFTVNFNSASTSKFSVITAYYWDFGDGSYSKLKNPSHIYLQAGKFTVKLKIVDQYGCFDEIIYKDLVLINGPVGLFEFDKKEGCTPLQVKFKSTLFNTRKIEWDMGDGIILEDSLAPIYVYKRVGTYIPVVVLSDSFGCTYTLPPFAIIKVFPYPVADFTNSIPCVKQPVSFTNMSSAEKGAITKSLWDFGDGDTSSQLNPSHIFKNKGSYKITLKVWNTDGCEGELIKQITIKNTSAAFKTEKEFYCTGQIPKLINTSQSETSFKSYAWFLNDTFISNQQAPILPKMSTGQYKITLAVLDNYGCTDTLSNHNGIIVGDTLPPLPPFIYRVSVETDHSMVIDFSGNKDFDFKNYDIYNLKDNNFYKVLKVMAKNDTSQILNSLNTLHNVYCYKMTTTNLCGVESDINLSLAHCSVETKAIGQLKQVNVAWNAYKGWPVSKYEVYREDLGLKGKYDYLATVSGSQLNYIDTNVYCKIQHFYKVKAYQNLGYYQISWSDTTAAKPLFANSVPPNNTIRATVDFDKEVTIEWTGSGSPRIPIKQYVIEKSEDGFQYKWYQSFKPDQFAYTDKKVSVDLKSYFYRTYAIDTCELRSPITNFAKTILLKADTTVTERPYVKWSSYKGWNEGVNQYEVQRKKPDGSFVTIGITSSVDSTLIDQVTDLNGYPFYCYRVIGYKNMVNGEKQIISISNEDCAPVRSRIFAANAFTVNGDNLNETFDIKGLYIKDYNLKIFTRWGEMVFESHDMNHDWDGFYKGKMCQMDAYIWIIKAVGVDNINWPLSGTVTLIR